MPTPTKRISTSTYPSVEIPELGSWNPNAEDSNPETNEVFVAKNYRMEKPGHYTTRTGYTPYYYDNVNAGCTVYSVQEYDIGGQILAVIFFYDPVDQKVYALVFNTDPVVVLPMQVKVTLATGITTAPLNVAAEQFAEYLTVTIHDTGLFLFYPDTEAHATSTNPADWVVRPLGKVVASLPSFVEFAETTTDDLVVRTTHLESGHSENVVCDILPGQNEPAWVRFPIQAKYWLDASTVWNVGGIGQVKLQQWKFDKNDPTNYTPGFEAAKEGFAHVTERGWGYKVVFVMEYTDPKGNLVTRRSQPSVDFWVENRMYCPAIPIFNGTGGSTAGKIADGFNHIGSPHDQWRTAASMPWGSVAPPANTIDAAPTQNDFQNLQDTYRKYLGEDISNSSDQRGLSDVLTYGAARFLGWGRDDIDAFFYKLPGGTPYVAPITAYDLKQAPMTKFKWSNFTLPAETVKIEIYRTAYNGVSAQDTTAVNTQGSALFQPHLYGYVGTLDATTDLTDDIKDSDLVWAKSPDTYEGYEIGTLSGAVIREYLGKIAIGNITSDYTVFAPAPTALQQAVMFNLLNGGATMLTTTFLLNWNCYYQYEDANGFVSDLTEVIPENNLLPAPYQFNSIVFRVPWGYDPTIVKVDIILKNAGIYYKMASVTVGTGYYTLKVSDLSALPSPYTNTTATVKHTVAPGTILYSDINDPFSFPFGNTEIIHLFAPIVAMETITGPLWVWTDRSLTLTTLNKDDARTEEEHKRIGCVGFRGMCKGDKIVFFLSNTGLYYAEASGVVPFPAYVGPLLFDYIQADPEAMQDASLVYYDKRQELWLNLPSIPSVGLPARIIVYKLFNGLPSQTVNYDFDFQNGLDSLHVADVDPVVSWRSLVGGRLLSAHFGRHYTAPSTFVPSLIVQSNDDNIPWLGAGYIEKRYPLGSQKKKRLRSVVVRAAGDASSHIATGRIYNTGIAVTPFTADYRGDLYNDGTNAVQVKALSISATNANPQVFRHVVPLNSVDSTGYVLSVRLTTEPNAGKHDMTFYGLGAYIMEWDHP